MKNHRTVRYNIQIFCKRRNDSLELYLLGFQIWVYVDSIIQTVISLWFLYESWWYFLHLHQSWKLSLLNWSKFTIGQAETLQCIYCLWCQVTDLILTAKYLDLSCFAYSLFQDCCSFKWSFSKIPFCLLFNCPAGCVIIVLQKMCQSDWCPCVMVQSCPRCPLTGWQLFFCGSWILWCSPSSPVPGTGPDLLMLARLSNVNYTLFVLTG